MENLTEFGHFWLNENTNEIVARILNAAYDSKQRLRLFYGDNETGRDWLEENDVTGKIGCSTGTKKIPLLINNARSYGGGGILTDCIVKIIDTATKRTIWQHQNYHQPALSIEQSDLANYVTMIVTWENGQTKPLARFKKEEQAQRWLAFVTGQRMAK